MASYPTSIFAPATIVAGNTGQPSQINDPNAEIVAMETALVNGPINLPASTLASLSVTAGSTLTTLHVTGASTFAGPVVFSSAVTFGTNGALTAPRAPACHLTGSATMPVANGAWTGLSWDVETYDSGLHSTGVNSSRITVDSTGLWLFGLDVTWSANSSNSRLAKINLNDSSGIAGGSVSGAGWPGGVVVQNITTLYPIRAATDYVTALVYQDSGSTGSVTPLSTVGSLAFWARKVSG